MYYYMLYIYEHCPSKEWLTTRESEKTPPKSSTVRDDMQIRVKIYGKPSKGTIDVYFSNMPSYAGSWAISKQIPADESSYLQVTNDLL